MESVHQNCTPSMAVTKTWTGLGLDWSNSSPLNISSIWHRIFNTQCTYHVILLLLLVLFLRLFQALLMLALDMMDDDNDIVKENPREMAAHYNY